EAALITSLQPDVNVQIGPPDPTGRAIPRALVRDVIVLVPSVEDDSVELVAARADGAWMIQRTRRSGVALAVHTQRLMRFFRSALKGPPADPPLAPIGLSWFARRGADATRLDPRDARDRRELRARPAGL